MFKSSELENVKKEAAFELLYDHDPAKHINPFSFYIELLLLASPIVFDGVYSQEGIYMVAAKLSIF